MSESPGWQREAARQQALLVALAAPSNQAAQALAGLLAPRQTTERALRGLAAYRANAQALADRALAAACPTLVAMVGEEQFPALARAFWRTHPPTCGDIGEWGGALPDWLAAEPSLADWPWLADAARLDLALHHCERAADASFDGGSLGLLGEHEPEHLQLMLMPGTALLRSAHPVVTMYTAHRADRAAVLPGDAPESNDAVVAMRAALAAGQGESALVWRRGWRAAVCQLDPATAAWTADLLAGADLATLLDRHAAFDAFEFSTWLQQAVLQGWLKGVSLKGDRATDTINEDPQ